MEDLVSIKTVGEGPVCIFNPTRDTRRGDPQTRIPQPELLTQGCWLAGWLAAEVIGTIVGREMVIVLLSTEERRFTRSWPMKRPSARLNLTQWY